jgi:AAA domain
VSTPQISRTPRPRSQTSTNMSTESEPDKKLNQILKPSITPPDRWEGKLYMPLTEAFAKVGQAEQVIRNWLPSTGVSFILAKFGLGKTLLLFDQAMCLATDRDWMGNPTAKGRFSVYLCGEDQEGALANAEAWCKQNGVDPGDPCTRIIFVPLTPNLLDESDCRSLVLHIRQKLPEGARPVIFLDTWQRSTSGGGQNEDKDMQTAIKNAEFIGKELGGPVVAASHPPKGNMTTISGSGVIENSSVAIWKMEPKSNSQRQVTVTRIKGAGQGSQILCHIETRVIDGLDNYGCARKGAVLLKDELGIGALKPLVHPNMESALHGPDEEALLISMLDQPCLSYVKRAEAMGLFGATGKPNESHIKNKTNKLKERGYVCQGKCEGDSYALTDTGVSAAQAAKSRAVTSKAAQATSGPR